MRRNGRGFWIRPAIVELICSVGLAALYDWCCVGGGLLGALPADALQGAAHLNFLALAGLFWLLGTASLIDADEQTIPDGVTLPGTLLGLLCAAAYPWSLLPAGVEIFRGQAVGFEFLHVGSPNPWPDFFSEWPGLAIGCACWGAWCLAVMPWRWYGRHGWRRALGIALARIRRDVLLLGVGAAGALALAAVWCAAPVAHWAGLLSALVGLAAGGGVIWTVRILGTRLLGQEAMGFGDVTLMAMIGTFIGWQSCVIVFFLAPFAGAVIALVKLIVSGNRDIAYGPFLCLGTLVLVIGWTALWPAFAPFYSVWWLVPVLMAVCMVLLVVLLGSWVWLRNRLFGG